MVCRPAHENDPLEKLRHSAAHVMASAVQALYPGTQVAIGPVIEGGFYYDFDTPKALVESDLAAIEGKMREMIAADLPFERKELSRAEAIRFFQQKKEKYKVEIIEDLPAGETITVYQHGDWVDLCKGPHVARTSDIRVFKLLSVAGAYWRGDEKREQLQRIYGTAFFDQASLDDYLTKRQEAEARDHRKLGRILDLFSSLDEKGAGLILWHPRGARVRHEMETYWREAHLRGGYELVYTPHLARRDLWQTSGHLDFYAENMFAPLLVDDVPFQLKPMNCPFHIMIYKKRRWSYRELPLRWAELGTVYRYERSGVLHGLMRVRGFTQDDAHIFCRENQLGEEIDRVLAFTLEVLSTFGFRDYEIYLSTKPEQHVGSDAHWELATQALRQALERRGLPFAIDPGEGVFYGPKIDVKIKDVLGRAWQCSTIQIDFNLPERFNVTYVGEDAGKHRVIMIHRALLGSLERFFGVLIEHYAGAFPLWLAPEQVRILTISAKHDQYAGTCLEELRQGGLRVVWDSGPDKLGAKIREAELMKVPYMVIIGGKEATSKVISVRSKKEGDLGQMTIEQFMERAKSEIASRASG